MFQAALDGVAEAQFSLGRMMLHGVGTGHKNIPLATGVVHIQVHVCMYKYMYACTCMHVQVHVCMYTHMCHEVGTGHKNIPLATDFVHAYMQLCTRICSYAYDDVVDDL
jgi:hypothetical protein